MNNDRVNRVLEKLETYYPEHKVFALDSIDSHLRERISILAWGMGYSNVDRFLQDHGFEQVPREKARELRSTPICSPGDEPAIIRLHVQSMLSRLEEYYPNHVISKGLQADHKSLSKDISGLYLWLGYADAQAMLKAYGFEYLPGLMVPDGIGRPRMDYQPVIEELTVKYREAQKPKSVLELCRENPQYTKAIKSMQASATHWFGMSLVKYFEQIGIIDKNKQKESSENTPHALAGSVKQSQKDELAEKSCLTAERCRQKLDNFTVELRKRYAGKAVPQALWKLRRDNQDLPFVAAESWVRSIYGQSLIAYLRDQQLISVDTASHNRQTSESASSKTSINDEKTTDHSIIETEDARSQSTALVEQLSASYPKDTNKPDVEESYSESAIDTRASNMDQAREDDLFSVAPSPQFHISKVLTKNPEGNSVASYAVDGLKSPLAQSEFSSEYIDTCVKKDTDGFETFVNQDQLTYGLAEIPRYKRLLYRLEISEYLEQTRAITYLEYLVINGIVPQKTSAFWVEQLVRYLRSEYLECSSGMLVSSKTSFEYDKKRQISKISAPLFNGYERVTNLQIAEKHSGKLSLQPCYCNDNYAFDVALTSNNEIIGQLNRTLFTSTGLGSHLAPLLYSKAAYVKNVWLSKDDYPNVIFELQFTVN